MSAIVFPLFMLIFVLGSVQVWLDRRKKARAKAETEKAREGLLMDGRDIWGFQTSTGGDGGTNGSGANIVSSPFSLVVTGGGGGGVAFSGWSNNPAFPGSQFSSGGRRLVHVTRSASWGSGFEQSMI